MRPIATRFYGGDTRGYVDYPFRDGTVKASLDEILDAAVA